MPHVIQSTGSMFSVFLTDQPVRDFAGASRTDAAAYGAFFHAMLDRGVHLPPSAYEAWFVSAAHDDRAVQTRARRTAGRSQRPPRRRGFEARRSHLNHGEAAAPDTETWTPDTVVHLVRHGEVHNPDGVLYGRRDGFHLSDLGRAMAEKAAASLATRDVTVIRSSPLERARETAAPLGDRLGPGDRGSTSG